MSRSPLSGRSETRAFLGLGGNLGDPAAAMASALRALDSAPGTRVAAVSSLYRTPPWGKTDQPDFLNAVAEVATVLQPSALLQLCLDTERELKRERRERWGPRLIDIDVLLYGAETVQVDGLEIPHPRMLDRAFVLLPLSEIAPGLGLGGRRVEDWLETVGVEGIERLDAPRDWWLRASGPAA